MFLITIESIQIYFMSNNPENYLNNPLNKSVSKCTHAFAKAERFLRSRKIQTEAKYHLPSTIDHKSCGFGYGQKMSLIINRCSPPPGTYQSTTDFKKQKNKSFTPSFGKGRQSILFGSYLTQAQKKSRILPSPNKYDIRLPPSRIGGRIGIRLQTEPDTRRTNKLPGPGTYNLDAIHMVNSSSFILSNFKKSISPRYYNSKTIDISRERNSNSILCYDVQDRQFGKSRSSKFRNVSVTSFGKSKREGIVQKAKLQVPGFKYNIFSEFGK